ncbi:MAG: hypothetical protein D3906_09805 [Candidatus Electrothrix sp. AUS1_2]|nr:hypothetical protein [Candidatus Electrothrix sp. AUS1_2]
MITGIGCIWEYALKYKEHKDGGQDYIKITDQDMLDSFVNERTRMYIEKSFKKPSFIPTGVYIESMNFRSTTEISLSGNIWQEYPNDFPDDLKGVRIFPAIKSKIQQIYTKKLDNSELIRSRFEVDIPVHISSSKYPLEVDEITVQFLPMDNSLVTFVLDLKGTPVDATVRLPGLNKNVVLPGWTLTHTFFALEQGDADSSFGVKENYDQEKLPVLSYRIGIKRIFINAFISNLTPLIVVTIILFFVLLLPSDTDISKIIGICSSLFFVVVFSHLAIRKTIVIGELFYLEYFFFVIYAAVVMTPIRIFLLSLCREKDFLDYRNGLLFKAAYWPVLLGLLLVVTACEFY